MLATYGKSEHVHVEENLLFSIPKQLRATVFTQMTVNVFSIHEYQIQDDEKTKTHKGLSFGQTDYELGETGDGGKPGYGKNRAMGKPWLQGKPGCRENQAMGKTRYWGNPSSGENKATQKTRLRRKPISGEN